MPARTGAVHVVTTKRTYKGRTYLTHLLRRNYRKDGTPVHGFQTLLQDLASIVRNTCRAPRATQDEPTFEAVTTASPQQRRALELIAQIHL